MQQQQQHWERLTVPNAMTVATACVGVAVGFLGYRFLSGTPSDSTARGFVVVITGGTRGIGYSLAEQMLQFGDTVIITGRQQPQVDKAVTKLGGERKPVSGLQCDITRAADVKKLVQFVIEKHGQIDLFVNNAGCGTSQLAPLVNTSPEDISKVVNTNMTGAMLTASIALDAMRKQKNPSHFFFTAGGGSSGRATPNYAAYGFTKAGVRQLQQSLVKELQELRQLEPSNSVVGVHVVSPGMVFTDLLIRPPPAPAPTRSALKIFNILAVPPQVATAWLAPRIRGARGTSSTITYMSLFDAALRFLTHYLWPRKVYIDVDNYEHGVTQINQ
eukprot:TRINITY_DN2254_c0_g1_i1.p1 TRINITY_DN2254_c0_g1~~TRINITY_DN2254_c0_g1_i1.p1  ORF type:complete len:330 (-),score=53.08 TRINITY_DN2254_c0_g1_i1:593-1582(-)